MTEKEKLAVFMRYESIRRNSTAIIKNLAAIDKLINIKKEIKK
jgi:hypothetical protein